MIRRALLVAGLAGAQDYCRRPPGAAKVVYYTAREPVDMRHLDSRNFTSAAMPRCNGFPKA